MAFVTVDLPTATIASGTSTSNVIKDIGDAYAITIFTPATLTSTGVTLGVEPSSSGTNFVTLQSGGTDVVLPAGRATIISPPAFKQLRIESSSAEGADRVFSLVSHMAV
jgi:hypothetical protein